MPLPCQIQRRFGGVRHTACSRLLLSVSDALLISPASEPCTILVSNPPCRMAPPPVMHDTSLSPPIRRCSSCHSTCRRHCPQTAFLFEKDFVICEVTSATEGECIDRSPVSTRSVPSPDLVGPAPNVTGVSIEDDWTTITFMRDLTSLDDEDYDLAEVCYVLLVSLLRALAKTEKCC